MPGERLVIDGLRHTEAFQAISDLSGGQSIKLIYLYAPVEIRNRRGGTAGGNSDVRNIDAHEVESQTNSQLRDMADLAVDASRGINEVFAQIANWVREEYQEHSA